jgi:hypothetical protein
MKVRLRSSSVPCPELFAIEEVSRDVFVSAFEGSCLIAPVESLLVLLLFDGLWQAITDITAHNANEEMIVVFI